MHSIPGTVPQVALLDNPNQVDKEASQYVMAGLWHLYMLTENECYLAGAVVDFCSLKAPALFPSRESTVSVPSPSGQ